MYNANHPDTQHRGGQSAESDVGATSQDESELPSQQIPSSQSSISPAVTRKISDLHIDDEESQGTSEQVATTGEVEEMDEVCASISS